MASSQGTIATHDFCVRDNGSISLRVDLSQIGSGIDLTGYTIFMQVRAAGPDTDLLATFDNAGNGGIVVGDATEGIFQFAITNAMIRDILVEATNAPNNEAGTIVDGEFEYDLVLIPPTGLNRPILQGSFEIELGVSETP